MNALDTARNRVQPVRPSPVFFVIVATTGLGVWLCIDQRLDGGIATFVFVFAGWILSLVLHEFAHAFTAYRGGDRSVIEKGYLNLDPRHYTDPLTSIALPLLFLIIGGLGLPGGAVWINTRALRSPGAASLVSLAGPAVNLVLASVCLLLLSTETVTVAEHPVLAPALAFGGFLQVVAFVLNMLPIPGLDGFGVIEPFLPSELRSTLAPVSRWGMFALFGVLIWVPGAGRTFWTGMLSIVEAFSVDRDLVVDGWELFRFWT